jgi:hypothetical protein
MISSSVDAVYGTCSAPLRSIHRLYTAASPILPRLPIRLGAHFPARDTRTAPFQNTTPKSPPPNACMHACMSRHNIYVHIPMQVGRHIKPLTIAIRSLLRCTNLRSCTAQYVTVQYGMSRLHGSLRFAHRASGALASGACTRNQPPAPAPSVGFDAVGAYATGAAGAAGAVRWLAKTKKQKLGWRGEGQSRAVVGLAGSVGTGRPRIGRGAVAGWGRRHARLARTYP